MPKLKINIIGGGPAGLYFAILAKRHDPAREVAVFERNAADDTFGWGIVFSDQTFAYLSESDPQSCQQIIESCVIWDNVDIVHRGERVTIRGNRFSGVGRLKFLQILQERARALGVRLNFEAPVDEDEIERYRDCDLLVGADGVNSVVRRSYQKHFAPALDARRNRYIWLGTPRLFEGLTLTFRESEAGHFIAHSYKFDAATSTFIVECSERTWERAGFAAMSEAETCRYLEAVFAADIGSQPLHAKNYARWINFVLVRNRRWFHENIVLIGDSLHTAHFSIGSGTKLALEDAIALAGSLSSQERIETALAEFERERRPVVESLQEAAMSSLHLFESIAEDEAGEWHLSPLEFAYKLMTRSGRITYEKLKRRDPEFIAAYEKVLSAEC